MTVIYYVVPIINESGYKTDDFEGLNPLVTAFVDYQFVSLI